MKRLSDTPNADIFIAEARKRRLAKPFLAYIMATAWHETGGTMEPVKENLNYSATGLRKTFRKYFTAEEAKKYERKPVDIANRAYANRIGNGDEASGDGWKYRGRGYVQLTGRRNYAEFSVRLGVDLVNNPDLACDPKHACAILFDGMMDGTFTGVGLRKYIKPGVLRDFVEARRVVNGTDKAELIAGYAGGYMSALEGVDLLSDSQTIKAAKSSVTASNVGAVASVGAVIKGITDVVGEDPAAVVGAARQGMALGDIIPWLAVIAPALIAAIFIFQRMQAKKVEKERIKIAEEAR
jgi:putative chitinase